MVIFAAATLYGIGKTFFWPTMLGVVSEQTPKGGALTLNAISGIGMLAVGTLGFPYIGALQANKQIEAYEASTELAGKVPGLVENGKLSALSEKSIYEVIKYKATDDAKVGELVGKLPEADQTAANDIMGGLKAKSSQGALADMALFPMIMLVCYGILIYWFNSRGGYKPIELGIGEKSPEEKTA